MTSSVNRFGEMSPLWQKSLKSLAIFRVYLPKFLFYWANFHCCKLQKMKNNSAIWSRWWQVGFYGLVQRLLCSIPFVIPSKAIRNVFSFLNLAFGVTRFGKIPPLWHIWPTISGLFGFGQSFQLTLTQFECYRAHFHCWKWPNIENTIWTSGHTAFLTYLRLCVISKNIFKVDNNN